MKRYIICMVATLTLLTGSAMAQRLEQRNEFGLGFVIGEPSGINAQFFWSPRSAVDFTAAWSFNDWFMLIGDYQVYDYIADSPREWRWYYGGGAWVAFPENDDGTLGVRVPLGIRYRIPRSIVDLWVEIAPALELVPDTEPELQGGLGVTFWLR